MATKKIVKKPNKTQDITLYNRAYGRERISNREKKINFIYTFPTDYTQEEIEDIIKLTEKLMETLDIKTKRYTPGRKRIPDDPKKGEEILTEDNPLEKVEEIPINPRKEIISRFREILSQN